MPSVNDQLVASPPCLVLLVDVCHARHSYGCLPGAIISVRVYGPNLPGWLVVLWLGFSTFVWSIRWPILNRHPALIISLGGLGGMMSYLAGERLGAVSLPLGLPISALIILCCWLLFSALVLGWLRWFTTDEVHPSE